MARMFHESARALDGLDVAYNACVVSIATAVDWAGIACRNGWIKNVTVV